MDSSVDEEVMLSSDELLETGDEEVFSAIIDDDVEEVDVDDAVTFEEDGVEEGDGDAELADELEMVLLADAVNGDVDGDEEHPVKTSASMEADVIAATRRLC